MTTPRALAGLRDILVSGQGGALAVGLGAWLTASSGQLLPGPRSGGLAR